MTDYELLEEIHLLREELNMKLNKIKRHTSLQMAEVAKRLDDVVAEEYCISSAAIHSKDRTQLICEARYLCAQWLFLAGWSDRKVMEYYGRDRTSARHYHDMFDNLVQFNDNVCWRWNNVCEAMDNWLREKQ